MSKGSVDEFEHTREQIKRYGKMSIGELMDLADNAVKVLQELCETSIDTETVMDHARAVLKAIDEERERTK